MPKHATSQNLLNCVKTLLPIIRQGAEAAERQGHLTDEVLNALFEQRLFRLFIAEKYQGESTDLVTALQVFERIASADGATGWLVMIGAGGGLFSGFMEESAAREIFLPERAVIAGSGMPSGNATTVANGFEVSGRWTYASGAHHATWFTANCKIDNRDDMMAIAVPAIQVQVYPTWSVFGMKATGSHDFSVESVPVAKNFTFSLSNPPFLDDPIYHCPLETLASLSFASVALGIAQHALDEFNTYAQHKHLAFSAELLVKDADIQNRCAQATSLITAARNRLYALAEKVWQTVENGIAPAESLGVQVQQMGETIVQDCVKAADLLKARAGMMAVASDSTFGRAWRDLHTLSQHSMIAPK